MHRGLLLGVAVLVAAALGAFWILRDGDPDRRAAPGRRGVSSPTQDRRPAVPARVDPERRSRRVEKESLPEASVVIAEALEGAATRLRAEEDEDEEARRLWKERRRRLLLLVRDDGARATELLIRLASCENEQLALLVAGVLPFVRAPGFEEQLIEAATATGSPLQRQIALVGLRGRGANAAAAANRVAAEAEDVSLRARATEELASHVSDPAVIRQRESLLVTVRANLAHEEAEVRRAAVRVLLASRTPDPASTERLKELARSDPDESVRRYATRILERWGSG